MTKPGYTHIIVPLGARDAIRNRARMRGLSMSRYIIALIAESDTAQEYASSVKLSKPETVGSNPSGPATLSWTHGEELLANEL